MRSKARECAFKVIYASLFRQDGEFNRSIYKTFGLDQEESAYADGLLDAVAAHRQELLQALGGLSIGFSEQRLFPVDKSILLMAMAELKYGDVPAAVCGRRGGGGWRRHIPPKRASASSTACWRRMSGNWIKAEIIFLPAASAAFHMRGSVRQAVRIF